MKTALKIITSIVIIIGLGLFLTALYTTFDPKSKLTNTLKTIPLFKYFVAEEDDKEIIPITPADQKSDKKYVEVNKTEKKHSIPLLEGERLYSAPDDNQKLPGTIDKTGYYKVIATSGNWLKIENNNQTVWIKRDTFDISKHEVSPEIAQAISGGRRLVTLPKEYWYDEMVGKYVKEMKDSIGTWNHKTEDYINIYYRGSFKYNLEYIVSSMKELEKYYLESFQPVVSGKIYPFDLSIFMIPSREDSFMMKHGAGFLMGGEHRLGIITINLFNNSPATVLSSILHEYTHHLNRTVFEFPVIKNREIWLDEGLAEYYSVIPYPSVLAFYKQPETQQKMIKDQLVHSSEVQRGPFKIYNNEIYNIVFRPILKSKLLFAKSLYKNDKVPLYKDIFNDDSWKMVKNEGKFEELRAYYTTSWLTIAYLMDGEDGKYRSKFLTAIQKILRGELQNEELANYIGLGSMDDLSKKVNEYFEQQLILVTGVD
ncbi:MAG: hypothetical protein JW737_03635 [Acidobacteria bacterium]|nr:hypothetical protein [Acidobacteriota bacterium]